MIKGLLFASVLCFGSAVLSQTMPDAIELFGNAALKEALKKKYRHHRLPKSPTANG